MLKHIKVAHIIENETGIGGLEKVVAILVSGLDRRKYEPELWFCCRGNETARLVADRGVTVREMRMKHYLYPHHIVYLAYMFRKNKIDILHTHGIYAGMIRIAALLAGTGILVHHYHTTFMKAAGTARWIDKALSRFTRETIVISNAVRKSYVDNGYAMKNATLIYNGIDDIGCSPQHAPGHAPVITCIGSLVEHKGHRILIEAMKEVVRRFPGATLQIAGEGPLRIPLQREVATADIISNVTFLGFIPDVKEILHRSDVVVLPSLREGFSLAAVEAMSAGIPVVASRVGGIPEVVVHGTTGVLVPPKIPEALADALCSLVNDETRRREMGMSGRQRYEREFTSKTMIKKVERLYETLRGEAIEC